MMAGGSIYRLLVPCGMEMVSIAWMDSRRTA
jgi:hypothetical protein